MIAVVLALTSSLAFGSADFAGGLASRHAHVLRVVTAGAPAGLAVYLLLLPLFGADWSRSALAWGAGYGLASAVTFALLYQALALGPMSILAPLTAVISAVVPVGVGLLEGERLASPAIIGVLLAVLAIVLVGGGLGAASGRPSTVALALAIGAGSTIAAQLVCLHQAPGNSGLAPLVVGRGVSTVVLVATLLAVRRRIDATPLPLALAFGSGVLSAVANLAFLVAVRAGELSIVAVITALYPAATVVLAGLVLREPVRRAQLAGLGAAVFAVALLALP